MLLFGSHEMVCRTDGVDVSEYGWTLTVCWAMGLHCLAAAEGPARTYTVGVVTEASLFQPTYRSNAIMLAMPSGQLC